MFDKSIKKKKKTDQSVKTHKYLAENPKSKRFEQRNHMLSRLEWGLLDWKSWGQESLSKADRAVRTWVRLRVPERTKSSMCPSVVKRECGKCEFKKKEEQLAINLSLMLSNSSETTLTCGSLQNVFYYNYAIYLNFL